jgi:disulfide bond formation protein DsbB
MAGPLTPQKPPSQLRTDLSVILAPRHGLMICAAMSAALLVGAFLFEYVGGLAPCRMCIWQRWAHVAVIGAAAAGLLVLPARTALVLTFLAAVASAGIAGYHAGVEWQLWDGPSGCTAGLGTSASAADLVDQLLATPVVRCDDVPWSLFGLSMAGWNMLFSLDISAIAILALIFGGRVARQA